MTTTETSKTHAGKPPSDITAFRRTVVYVVSVLGLLVLIWALTQGADRNLFDQPTEAALRVVMTRT